MISKLKSHVKTVSGKMDSAFDSVSDKMDSAADRMSDTMDSALDLARDTVSTVTGAATDARDTVVGVATDARDVVVGAAADARDAVVRTVREIPVDVREGELVVFGRGAPWGEAPVSEEEGTRTVYILLTKRLNITSLLLRLFTWNSYTHTSIALERDGMYYSFNPRLGFTIERPIHRKRPDTPCKLYELEVAAQTYAEIESRIHWHVNNPEAYKFNYLGLFFAILRIPVGIGNRYFCSQFVSQLIALDRPDEKRLHPNGFLPGKFKKQKGVTLRFKGDTGELADSYKET
ncbi:MAG: hypothetical protein LBR00_03650 [Clostridiales Family XIII bacterium]|nr:hypothetical protein [Clostridiales Family XIII bacterium]